MVKRRVLRSVERWGIANSRHRDSTHVWRGRWKRERRGRREMEVHLSSMDLSAVLLVRMKGRK